MEDLKRYNFSELAVELGYVEESDGAISPDGRPVPPAGGAQVPEGPEAFRQSSLRYRKIWPDERCIRLLDYFDDVAASGEPVEFEGHPICWAMIALMQKLRNNPVSLYIAPFGKSLELQPMQRKEDPEDNPILRFDVSETEEDVHIVVTLLGEGGPPDPFSVPMGDLEIKEIGSGKNIWLELAGMHYLFMFDFPKTFGSDCNAMYYKEGGETWYCVASSDPTVKIGDNPPESPFEIERKEERKWKKSK